MHWLTKFILIVEPNTLVNSQKFTWTGIGDFSSIFHAEFNAALRFPQEARILEQIKYKDFFEFPSNLSVSYTHLTLPTIYSV